MKIKILGNELIDGIRDVRDVTKCGDLSTIEVDAISDDLIVVRCVCFDGAAVQIRVRGKVHETGCACVCCRDLLQALSPFGRQRVTLSTNKALYAFVTCDGFRVKLEASLAGTPIVPASATCPRGVFAAYDIIPAVMAVRHAMADGHHRRILEGVQIEVGTDMKLRAIATDGRRLAVAEVQLTRAELPSPSYSTYLPRAAVEFLMRAPSCDDVEICDLKNGVVQCKIGDSSGAFERPDGGFPDWRQCVPKDPPFRAHFGLGLGTALANGIKALDIHQDDVDEEGEPVETAFMAHILAPKGSDLADICITRATGDGVPNFTTSTGLTAADYFETHVNARYLLEAIQNHLDVDIYADKIGTRPSPLVLKFPCAAWFYEVLMPLRG